MSSDQQSFDETREVLEEGGCDVVRCKETPAPTFACRGFVGRCPIDDGVAAAVVAGKTAIEGHPVDGASCAVRRRVPLVVAGLPADHPYGRWVAAEVRDPRRHLLAAMEEVTTRPSPDHSAIAQSAALVLLARWGQGEVPVRAAVFRAEDGRLRADVRAGRVLPRDLVHSLAETVRSRLRMHDTDAASIDVAVRTDATVR